MENKIMDNLIITEIFRFPPKKYEWQMRFINPRIYLFSTEQNKIIKQIPTPHAWFDTGEYRFLKRCYHYNGGRGISESDTSIFIALHNRILVYDKQLLQISKIIDHSLLNGIHEIDYCDGKLYIACAVTDSIAIYDEEDESFEFLHLGENDDILQYFHLTKRTLDLNLEYRMMHRAKRLLHINNVQLFKGSLYANFNLQGAFVRILPTFKVIISSRELINSHNGCFSPDGKFILLNDTAHYSLKVFDSTGNLINSFDLRTYKIPVDFIENKKFNGNHPIQAGWLRGLSFSHYNTEVVFLGLSPSMIIWINFMNGKLIGFHQFRRNIWATIHGIHSLKKSGD